ncbi:fatty acid metabolism regulator [Citrobacter koseri]|uniref:Fatty acid metabolism regulator n=1 Tax=Citrobacter koseri TaxID=545 RepID=A0A2X2VKM2_CITKO|nr:fatty acid metabolism regulator [Citrobacter koseri]
MTRCTKRYAVTVMTAGEIWHRMQKNLPGDLAIQGANRYTAGWRFAYPAYGGVLFVRAGWRFAYPACGDVLFVCADGASLIRSAVGVLIVCAGWRFAYPACGGVLIVCAGWRFAYPAYGGVLFVCAGWRFVYSAYGDVLFVGRIRCLHRHPAIKLQAVHSRRAPLQQLNAAILILLLQHDIKPPQAMHMFQHLFTSLVQRCAVVRNIA